MKTGALSGKMVDKALPPACVAEARAQISGRKGAWIDRTVKIIQAHNKSLEEHKGRCSICGHADGGIVWDPPKWEGPPPEPPA